MRAALNTGEAPTSNALRGGINDGATKQVTTRTISVDITLAEAEYIGDSIISLCKSDVLNDRFDELHLEILIGEVNIYDRFFIDEAEAEYFINNLVMSLGSLNIYNDGSGNVALHVTLTSVVYSRPA